jgi:hypothetical protein
MDKAYDGEAPRVTGLASDLPQGPWRRGKCTRASHLSLGLRYSLPGYSSLPQWTPCLCPLPSMPLYLPESTSQNWTHKAGEYGCTCATRLLGLLIQSWIGQADTLTVHVELSLFP